MERAIHAETAAHGPRSPARRDRACTAPTRGREYARKGTYLLHVLRHFL